MFCLLLSLSALLPLAALLPSCQQARPVGVTVSERDGVVTMQNALVRVEVDLEKGIYRAFEKRGNRCAVRDATLRINELSLDEPGSRRFWESAPVRDDLGAGRTLTVLSAAEGKPVVILEITLYEDHGFLVLAAGVDNITKDPLRVHGIHPLTGAEAFPQVAEWGGAQTLNGVAGAGETAVTGGTRRSSPNNLLVTVPDGEARCTLVMGGLTYREFAKYASTGWPAWTEEDRLEQLAALAPNGQPPACYLDCGANDRTTEGEGPALRLRTGAPYRWGGSDGPAPHWYGTVAFHDRELILEATGLDPGKHYALGFSWWDFDSNGRVESVSVQASMKEAATEVLLEAQPLPAFREDQALPEERVLALPVESYRTGTVRIAFTSAVEANAVVSEAWLFEAQSRDLLPVRDGARTAAIEEGDACSLDLRAEDPVGKLVDKGARYLPEDRFYVDFTTADPFEALERYARAVKTAQKVEVNRYDFPTVCGWYVTMDEYGGGPAINDTVGMVAEADHIVDSGFLKYSRAAVRLVPDTYTADNEQGWWDEAHWQRYGHYVAPYETSAKWAGAVAERGVLPFTYFQTGFMSGDYGMAFPGHLLFNDNSRIGERYEQSAWQFRGATYDYTDPEFMAHMREVWKGLGEAGVKGVMFDYPESGWCPQGGFEDPAATTASAYRNIFELAKKGLGPDAFIHERIISSRQPFTDLSLGWADSQRVWGDTDLSTAEMYTKCGLRWYKCRLLYSYDTDAKNLHKVSPDNRDGLRQMLTMLYLVSGRLLLATSFSKMTPQQLQDMSRVFPMHDAPLSARPADAFTGVPHPRVYDLAVSPDWHQVAFYNPDVEERAVVGADLSGDRTAGALGLDPEKSYYVHDFWNDRFVGRFSGKERLEQELRPGEARMMSVHAVQPRPQFISTNRHILQGFVDLLQCAWHPTSMQLSGRSCVVGREPYQVVIAVNGFTPVRAEAKAGAEVGVGGARAGGARTGGKSAGDARVVDARAGIAALPGEEGLALLRIDAAESAVVEWVVHFEM